MLRTILCGAVALMATSAFAAEGQDDLKAAAKKLSDAANYSWKTTTEFGGNTGPAIEGKTEKDGFTVLTVPTRDGSTREVVMKGEKVVIKTDEGWQTPEELSQGDGGQPNPGRFMANMVRRMKAPGAQVEEFCDKVKDLKKSGDAYEGELSEDAAKEMLSFGGRGGGRRGGGQGGNAGGQGGNAGGQGGGPQISNAKGTIKLWTKDGVLSKYEVHVTGTRTGRDGNTQDIDRTTTVEVSDIGSTKVDVPEDAKKKLS